MALPKIREQIEARVKDTGDTMTGLLTLSGNPTADFHAATKKYVDTEIKDANYLPLEGGTMTGEIKIGQGDGYGIQLGAFGRINTTSGDLTNCTIVGMNGTGALIGHSNFSMIIRGSGERPTYNSSALALYNDILSLAPSKTGSGASGTWGISISGNAASATKATQDGNGATIASTYLKLAGGTVTGNITRNYVGQSWIDVTHGYACAIKLSAAASGGSASCLWSVKTNAGAWGCGGLSGNDNMYFSYGTDTNYNAGTNTLSGQIIFTPSGGIVVASNTEYTTYKARNIAAKTSALTSGSSSLASGNIYVQYE